MGPSGSGKTSLLRAMAGLWSDGRGKITFYVKDREETDAHTSDVDSLEVNSQSMNGELTRSMNRNSRGVFFLPQRPYMVLGSLRQQLLYPTWTEEVKPASDAAKSAGMHLHYFTNTCNKTFKIGWQMEWLIAVGRVALAEGPLAVNLL